MVDLGPPNVRVTRRDGRPSADEMLDRVRREAGGGARGRHRVYVGIAPGVGKTYTALEELHRRKERGTDVAIGFIETHGRPKTAELAAGLELVPRKQLDYKGVTVEEMDTDAVIQRHPALALVDELAHTNAPGSKHEKRWQDVQDLLDAGITVISTVNIQHLESLADLVENITGVQVRERVPDRVLDAADEVELIDMAPHALRQRMKHGNVYPPERAERALTEFFREGNLIALREMALRKVAQLAEHDLEHYMQQEGIDAAWSACERVMVCIDDQPQAQNLIRRGWRMAHRYKTELLAVSVETPAVGLGVARDQARPRGQPPFCRRPGRRAGPRAGFGCRPSADAGSARQKCWCDRHWPLAPRPTARAPAWLSRAEPVAPGRRCRRTRRGQL